MVCISRPYPFKFFKDCSTYFTWSIFEYFVPFYTRHQDNCHVLLWKMLCFSSLFYWRKSVLLFMKIKNERKFFWKTINLGGWLSYSHWWSFLEVGFLVFIPESISNSTTKLKMQMYYFYLLVDHLPGHISTFLWIIQLPLSVILFWFTHLSRVLCSI